MTGLRPDSVGVTHNYVKFRESQPNVVTIPQYFVEHGYQATYVGKIFHHGDLDDDLSWTWLPSRDLLNGVTKPSRYADPVNTEIQRENKQRMIAQYGAQARFGFGSGPAIEGVVTPDNSYHDGYNTELGIAALEHLLNSSNKPIFFGFGMNKPHLPWVAPKQYWDLYNAEDISLAIDKDAPINGAAMGLHASFELRTFYDIPKYGDISEAQARELKHAYLASVSYVDAQIGRLLEAFENAGVLDNTIIVLWSDHGYHLGEKGIWGKASNYEIATRVPLVFWTPELAQNQREPVTSDALAELIDIFPTLAEMAGLPQPSAKDGTSLVSLFNSPTTNLKHAAFSQFPTPALREWGAFPLRRGMRETYFGPLIEDVEENIAVQMGDRWDKTLFETGVMGYTMRTSDYRLIAWLDQTSPDAPPLFVELYDENSDPLETNNIAAENQMLVSDLLNQLYVSLSLPQQGSSH
ncbi:iduronate-2-sulfatase [Alteromonas sp. KUL49]|nr:iduronate-2-sulfatase [Alteromonas sp. KUL49]